MKSVDEQILRTAKEIVVKFIETGRVSPTGFADTFESVYRTVHDTVTGGSTSEVPPPAEDNG
ncbi:MAG: hypothetical protein ABIL58_02580 [Pseudomonadota bacterium]